MSVITSEIYLVQYLFEVGGVDFINFSAINDITTDSKEMNHSKTYQIQVSLLGTDGDGTIFIEQSADDTNFDDMNMTKKDFGVLSNNSFTFENTYFSGRYIRVRYVSGSNTGSVKILLTTKS